MVSKITYSLQVQNGDLVVVGSECQIVAGTSKLQQDLTLWLLSRVGSSRFHPTWGAALQSYIGSLIGSATQANVYNEIMRVLTNYQAMVLQLFSANPSIFSLAELPYSIDSINVSVTYDTVYSSIRVSNPAGSTQVTVAPSV